ncbi:MAG: molybdate ABC transporter substrate-binding protein [Alphaproteobacteria bacterium]|nr:molybdate ABC transporter substrate-binding protein [Alphaproteobacteria bacterium]
MFLRFLALLLVAASPLQAAERPLVAAAANVQFALEEIAEAFAGESQVHFRFTFGSSGNLARQIVQGAPFELFLSADEGYVDFLVARGRSRDDGMVYAEGRIVVFAPFDAAWKPDANLENLARAQAAGTIRRFAIANPVHAPYGRAARQALRRAGLWQRLRPTLVYGENVAQAAQFASSGSAEGGIIPLSLALLPALKARGRFVLIPADHHQAIRQRMVLLRGASPAAGRLYDYLQGNAARQVLARHGFAAPAEGG